MKYLQSTIQWGVVTLLSLYSILVFIRMVLGRVYLPFHDGFVLVLLIILGIVWILVPSSDDVDVKHPVSLANVALLILQGLLFIQILDLGGVSYFVLVLISLGVLGSTVVASGGVPLPAKMQSRIEKIQNVLPSIPGRTLLIGCILGITMIPWMIFWLGSIGVPVTTITVWAVVIGSIGLGYGVRRFMGSRSSKAIVGPSLLDLVSPRLKTIAHGLGVLGSVGILAGVVIWAGSLYFSQSDGVVDQAPEVQNSLVVSDLGGWLERDQGETFETEAAFQPDSQLVFTTTPSESGEYKVSVDGYLSDLGGQVRVIVQDEAGEPLLDQAMLPLQCELWVSRLELGEYVDEGDCPRFLVSMQTEAIFLEENTSYTITIRPGDEFLTAFEPDLQVNYGGYLKLKRPEIILQ